MRAGTESVESKERFLIRAYKVSHYAISCVAFVVSWLLFRYGDLHIIFFNKWFRYEVYVVAIYAVLLFFFIRTYNAYLIGYLRIRTMAFSQLMSQFFALAIIYVLVSAAWANIKNPIVFIYLLVFYFFMDCLWAYTANLIYFKLIPQKESVLLFGNDNQDENDLDFTGKPIERKYSIVRRKLCTWENMPETIRILDDYDAFFAVGLSSDCISRLTQYCVENDKKGFFIPNIGDILFQRAHHIQSFHEPVLRVSRKKIKVEYAVIKRAFDIIASSLGIIILSPFMLITAIAIKAYDGGPAVYKQTRLTAGERQFTLYKFRSMRTDAEKDGVARLSTGEVDDRITPIGHIIRAIRFDELPQLFNILKGDMTIVGPRPERPEIAEKYYETLPEFKLRLQVKAGLTGYAQVYGKYNTSPEQKLKFDLMYINNMGILTDLKLMFATLGILFVRKAPKALNMDRLRR